MSRDFPDLLDPWKAADGRRAFQGTIPLKRMTRLGPLLASSAGEASFDVRFAYNQQKDLIIYLSVDADLKLICQRSLLPYNEAVSRKSELMVIRDLAEQELMPEGYDPVQVEHGRLALVNLVEDELLLGVPQIPRNPAVAEIKLSTDGEQTPASEIPDERLQRPFADLANLLKKSSQK
jgi:uncharacterized protein